jgi:hypothetical protein
LRKYHVEKNDNYFGFGIILHTERDDDDDDDESYQVYYPILEIENSSPALTAGLTTDQRLIAVDGKYINTDLKTIENLAQCIDECYYMKGYADLLVIEPEDWEKIKDNNDLLVSLCEPKENSNKNEQEQESVDDQESIDETIGWSFFETKCLIFYYFYYSSPCTGQR